MPSIVESISRETSWKLMGNTELSSSVTELLFGDDCSLYLIEATKESEIW